MSFTLAACCLAPATEGIASAGPLHHLSKSFPGAISISEKGRLIEFCPDNTCDGFLAPHDARLAELRDFAYLYIYFFSDFYVLQDWRAKQESQQMAGRVLSKAEYQRCKSEDRTEMARCVLLHLSRGGRIRLLSVRYDEGKRNVAARDMCASSARCELARQIVLGNTTAMKEAGRTGDRYFVSFLVLAAKESEDSGFGGAQDWARRALAKLGDKDELQRLYCEVHSDDEDTTWSAVGKLSFVGGWYSISILQELLEPDAESKMLSTWITARSANPQARIDQLLTRPSALAMEALSKLVPEPLPTPPYFDSAEAREKKAEEWHAAISARQVSLMKLEPRSDVSEFPLSRCRERQYRPASRRR